jgi:hypothetical protein
MKKLILFLLMPIMMLAQKETNFLYGIKNAAAVENSTPTYFVTQEVDGVHKKTPAASLIKPTPTLQEVITQGSITTKGFTVNETNNVGVFGVSTNNTGVIGFSNTGYGINATSGNHVGAILAVGINSTQDITRFQKNSVTLAAVQNDGRISTQPGINPNDAVVKSQLDAGLATMPFEKINEGNGFGYVIRGRNPAFYGNIGGGAFDFSISESTSSVFGATGTNSFAFGDNVVASNYGSISFGSAVINNGIESFSTGINNKIVSGYNNFVTGIGHDVKAMSVAVVGQAANIINQTSADYNSQPTSPVFVVGNGTIANNDPNYTVTSRSDALIVRKNGIVEAPSLTTAKINAGLPTTLVTKEYLGTLSGTPDATTTVKGKIQLAGDLSGTADAPTVPALANKADLVGGKVPASQLPTTPTPTLQQVTQAGSTSTVGIIVNESDGEGVTGNSTNGVGVYGNSTNGVGAVFGVGSTSTQDITRFEKNGVTLAAVKNDGRISTQPGINPNDATTVSQLDAKENTVTSGTTAQYYRGDKTWQTLDKTAVGLSNVDNTSDLNKPISTDTNTALNLKTDFPTINSRVPVRTANGTYGQVAYSITSSPNSSFPLRSLTGTLEAETAIQPKELPNLAQVQALVGNVTTVLATNTGASLGALNANTTVNLNLNTGSIWTTNTTASKTGATVSEIIDPTTGRIKDVADKNLNTIRVVIEYSQSGGAGDGVLTGQLVNPSGVVIDQESEPINVNGQAETNVRGTFRFFVVKTSDNNDGYTLRLNNGAKALTSYKIVSVLRNNNP